MRNTLPATQGSAGGSPGLVLVGAHNRTQHILSPTKRRGPGPPSRALHPTRPPSSPPPRRAGHHGRPPRRVRDGAGRQPVERALKGPAPAPGSGRKACDRPARGMRLCLGSLLDRAGGPFRSSRPRRARALLRQLHSYEARIRDCAQSTQGAGAVACPGSRTLSGTWSKQRGESDSMDQAFEFVKLPWLLKKATLVLNRLEVRGLVLRWLHVLMFSLNLFAMSVIADAQLAAGGLGGVLQDHPQSRRHYGCRGGIPVGSRQNGRPNRQAQSPRQAEGRTYRESAAA